MVDELRFYGGSVDADHHSIASSLGGRLTASTPLLGGSSTTVHRLDIDRNDVSLAVVSRRHGDGANAAGSAVARREFDVLSALHEAGFPVPEPFLVDDSGDAVVTEFVPGIAEVRPNDLLSALDQMADTLVELHAADPNQVTSLAPIENPVVELPRYLPNSDLGRRVTDALVNVEVTANSPVIVHGDYWPGNVLWIDGQLAAVIDWEDVCIGDPLADLACARVELLCAYGADAMKQFTDRYLHATATSNGRAIDTSSLWLWDIYVSATALAYMHQWNLSADEEAERRATTTEFFERAARELVALREPQFRTER